MASKNGPISAEKTLKDQNSSVNRDVLWEQCRLVAEHPNILDLLASEWEKQGMVGDAKPSLLVFLASYTRFFERPVNVVIKGASASGKSYAVVMPLKFVPDRAYWDISGASQKAFVHTKENLQHRHIMIGEFAGLQSQEGNPWLRQLLSEGYIKYAVTEKASEGGHEAETKEVKGPTGVFMTTTENELHPEDETRFISCLIEDTPERTRAILASQARREDGKPSYKPDFSVWHAFHDWVEQGSKAVEIPFRAELAELVSASSERIKRDFPQVLNLIKASALVHQHSRQRNADGCIVAELRDYEIVFQLTEINLRESEGTNVSPTVEQVIEALTSVVDHRPEYEDGAPQYILVAKLGLNKGTVSRAIRVAEDRGWVTNVSTSGREDKLKPAAPLPREAAILPAPDLLRTKIDKDNKS